MAISEASQKRLTELAREIRDVYVIVLGILARLPIPMTPASPYGPGAVDLAEVMDALSLAWNLMDAEPVTATMRGHVRDMLTAWMGAAEVAAAARLHGAAVHRNRIIEDALLRAREAAARAAIRLDLGEERKEP